MSTLEITSAKGDAIAALARMVAESAAFQDEAGVDEADALLFETSGRKRVHYPCLRANIFDELPLPFAVLNTESFGFDQFSDGSRNEFRARGSIAIMLARAIGDDNSPEGAYHEFCNWEEAVLKQVLDQAGVSDNLNIIDQPECYMVPSYTDARHEADQHAQVPRYQVGYVLHWNSCDPA